MAPDGAENERPKVLVVDDDRAVRLLAKVNLDGDGFEVIEAESGATAAPLAHEHQPVAIVLDLVMPDMDGWAVLAELRGDPDVARIPVLVLSARASRNDASKALAAGASEFLTKPFHPDALRDVVTRLARG